MVNDVIRDSVEWAFSIVSDLWPILILPFILFSAVTCFKSVCGLSGRCTVHKGVLCRSSGRVSADSVPAAEPVPASDRLYICSSCDDCPMLCKRDKCGLSGTAFCSIGKWVSKGGKLI